MEHRYIRTEKLGGHCKSQSFVSREWFSLDLRRFIMEAVLSIDNVMPHSIDIQILIDRNTKSKEFKRI